MKEDIIQTEHINKEEGTQYYKQYFETISNKRLTLEQYNELLKILEKYIDNL